MKSKRNSVESEVKQRPKMLKMVADDEVKTTVSNASFKALYQDLCKREQKIKELFERSGRYEHEIKELEERFGMYEQEIYEINLQIEQLRDNEPSPEKILVEGCRITDGSTLHMPSRRSANGY
jgi:predicted nuclease with TOPRIM domain